MSIQRWGCRGVGGSMISYGLACYDLSDYVLHTDYAALEARCAGLHKQLADVLEISTAVPFDRCILHAGERLAGRLMQVDALQAKLAAAEEALQFYADEEMWKKYGGHSTIDFDEGRRARAALADITTGEVKP